MVSQYFSPPLAKRAACLAFLFFSLNALAGEPTREKAPFFTKVDGRPALGTFSPGRWGVVGLTLANPGDREANLLSAESLSGNANLQFGRHTWVPSQSQRTLWLPVRPPMGPRRASMEVDAFLI